MMSGIMGICGCIWGRTAEDRYLGDRSEKTSERKSQRVSRNLHREQGEQGSGGGAARREQMRRGLVA